MKLSLVVCSRNRASQLSPCLRAISAMDKPEGFELIVVDNASIDNTSAVINNFKVEAEFPVRLAYEQRPGLGNARNCGWRHSQGDIIAFTDDDCYVDHDFAYAVLAAFRGNDRLGFLGGRILLFDPTDLRITIMESTDIREFPAGKLIPAGAIQGANFAFRRCALDAADGFDPLLGAGTPFPSEDIEMVSRLSTMGWSGVYVPEPVVYHHHGRKTVDDARRLRSGYDLGRGAYYMSMIMNPGNRVQALLFWIWCIRQQALARTLREIRGGFGYLLNRTKRRLHLFFTSC